MTKGLSRHKNYFFVCEQCRPDLKKKSTKERADRLDAERARDALRETVNTSARGNSTVQPRMRPRTDLAPDQIQTLDVIEQTVENQIAPLNQQLRSLLSNTREQGERLITNDDRTTASQSRAQPRRTKQTFAAAITKSSTPTSHVHRDTIRNTIGKTICSL